MKDEMRIRPEEIELIKATFKGNTALLKLLRKVFLPEIEPEVPLGQQIDLYMTIPTQGLTTEEKLINLEARNSLVRHIESQLLQLRILADTDAKTLEEAREAMKRDSSK